MSAQELLTCDISIHVCRKPKFSRPCPFLGHSAEFLRHLWQFRWNFSEVFAVIGPEFKNNYLVSNIRIPTKAVFESEISNSTEISKRGKIYVKLSEIWIYLPTYLSSFGRSNEEQGGAPRGGLEVMTWFCFCFRDVWSLTGWYEMRAKSRNQPAISPRHNNQQYWAFRLFMEQT